MPTPVLATAGDYQTQQRMQDKLRAIPLPDLTGKTVLDCGCDHGAFSKLAADMGAKRVLGIDRGRGVKTGGRREHVDLIARNTAQGWERCEFRHVDLGSEWPDLTEGGRWDVVLCFSLYHHVYGATGDHDAIWRWLADQTCPQGVLLWEGPVDTRDAIARGRSKRHGNYTRDAILRAARRYFHVELVGDAIHVPHREVWRCIPHGGPIGDHGDGVQGSGNGAQGVQAGANGGRRGADRVAPVSRNAQRANKKPCGGCGGAGGSRSDQRSVVADRTAPVVAGPAPRPAARPKRRAPRPDRKRREEPGKVPGGGEPAPPPVLRPYRRRAGHVDTRRAVVIGGAACVWDDYQNLVDLIGHEWDGLVVVVNDIGSWWPGEIDDWCTCHPERLRKWMDQRKQNGYPDGYLTVSGTKHANVKHVVQPNWGQGGSSGLLGVVRAMERGATRIVGCGIPMTKMPHFGESKQHPATKPWGSSDTHWRVWGRKAVAERLHQHFRSMSMVVDPKTKEFVPSRTRATFGAPDVQWLMGSW